MTFLRLPFFTELENTQNILVAGARSQQSHLPKDQIELPTSPHMHTRLTAMVQDVLTIAAGVFECFTENGHSVERSFLVDVGGYGLHGRGEPSRVYGDATERVAKYIP